MRVIAGTYRSRILKEVEDKTTRSTKDRVKESIFNSIQNKLYDSHVLDLFAGSGALGIEALSRGAMHCTFNELNHNAMKVLHDNIALLQIENVSRHTLDYEDFLVRVTEDYDVILLDPPYQMEVIDQIVETISKRKLLKEDGIVVCLYGKKSSVKEENNDIIEYKKKTIGVTNVSYMKWRK